MESGKGERTAQGLPAGCSRCNGAPFVIHDRGAGRCACPRGQALRQMDQHRGKRPQGELPAPRPVVYRSPLPDTQ
jgi:hypothetical protein